MTPNSADAGAIMPRWTGMRVARPVGDLGRSVASPNPYWNRTGRTFLDPDG
jgi:hypothetical protein